MTNDCIETTSVHGEVAPCVVKGRHKTHRALLTPSMLSAMLAKHGIDGSKLSGDVVWNTVEEGELLDENTNQVPALSGNPKGSSNSE